MSRGLGADGVLVGLVVWDSRLPWRLGVPDGTPPLDVTTREDGYLDCMSGNDPSSTAAAMRHELNDRSLARCGISDANGSLQSLRAQRASAEPQRGVRSSSAGGGGEEHLSIQLLRRCERLAAQRVELESLPERAPSAASLPAPLGRAGRTNSRWRRSSAVPALVACGDTGRRNGADHRSRP